MPNSVAHFLLYLLSHHLQNSLSRQISDDDRFATCGLLTTSICWEAMKNSKNSLKDWRKQLLVTAWKSFMTKANSSSTASSQDHLLSRGLRMDEEALEEVDQFKYLGSTQTKDGTPINELRIRLAQAHLSVLAQRYKAGNTMKSTKPSVFAQRLKSLNHFSLVNAVLWMWQLDDDGVPGETNPSLWKQMLQEDSLHFLLEST